MPAGMSAGIAPSAGMSAGMSAGTARSAGNASSSAGKRRGNEVGGVARRRRDIEVARTHPDNNLDLDGTNRAVDRATVGQSRNTSCRSSSRTSWHGSPE
jgi:hypothetical protein